MLSAIIITKNEAANIRRCLSSVAFANEIVVVDSGSTDDTLDICQEFTTKIHQLDWPGFGPQKNRALALASGDWILSIDADEIINDALRAEILNTLKSPTADAYSFLRQSFYCGKFIRHGDWRNDHVVRLFRKHKAAFSKDLVHESLIVNGKISKLKQPLLHYSFVTAEQVLQKINDYTSLSAAQKHKHGKSGGLFKAILHGLWTFLKGYILRRGFLDGKQGFMLAVSNAEGSYYRYIKMMLLKQPPTQMTTENPQDNL